MAVVLPPSIAGAPNQSELRLCWAGLQGFRQGVNECVCMIQAVLSGHCMAILTHSAAVVKPGSMLTVMIKQLPEEQRT